MTSTLVYYTSIYLLVVGKRECQCLFEIKVSILLSKDVGIEMHYECWPHVFIFSRSMNCADPDETYIPSLPKQPKSENVNAYLSLEVSGNRSISKWNGIGEYFFVIFYQKMVRNGIQIYNITFNILWYRLLSASFLILWVWRHSFSCR